MSRRHGISKIGNVLELKIILYRKGRKQILRPGQGRARMKWAADEISNQQHHHRQGIDGEIY
jgi:hypothetical protein